MRDCVLGNGSLAVCFDSSLKAREVFWPVPGLLNHASSEGTFGLTLVSSEGLIPVGGFGWDQYGCYSDGMVFRWELSRPGENLSLFVEDSVDPYLPLLDRRVGIRSPGSGAFSIATKQSFCIGESGISECAFWDASTGTLYHYKGNIWIGIKGYQASSQELEEPERVSAVVLKRRDGGPRVAPGGVLHGRDVDHGSIESVLLVAASGSESSFVLRFAFGHNREEVDSILARLAGSSVRVRSALFYASKGDKFGRTEADNGLARSSIMVLSSHTVSSGGTVAAFDGDLLGDWGDGYRYIWPRDAAFCSMALLVSGYPELAAGFLEFCAENIEPDGFFLQRYRPDNTPGSTWYNPGKGNIPIQEDETALPLVVLGAFLRLRALDGRKLDEYFRRLVAPAAGFILRHRQAGGTLVKASYDLWEERFGLFAYTQASCAAALGAAYYAARLLDHPSRFEYLKGCRELCKGLWQHFSSGTMYLRSPADATPDSSLFAIPVFLEWTREFTDGAAGSDEKLLGLSRNTFEEFGAALKVCVRGVEGIARYSGDWYMRPDGSMHLPGNIWPICTGFYLLAGISLGMLSHEECGKWIAMFSHYSTGGSKILPEQVNCLTGKAVGAAPLPWSHAMYLLCVRAAGLKIVNFASEIPT